MKIIDRIDINKIEPIIWIDYNIEFPNYMSDKLKEIAEKQSEIFERLAIEALSLESLTKLFKMTKEELKIRWIEQIEWINL